MANPGSAEWLGEQVRGYAASRSHYAAGADLLRTALAILCRPVAPSAQVQARAKTLASFGEKALRAAPSTPDPIHEFVDLCAARVIVSTRDHVDAVTQLLRRTFRVPERTTGGLDERIGPTTFGYRSVHLVVSLPVGALAGIPVPVEAVGIRAELQVRTMAEHAWADFAHDRTYKGQVRLPPEWVRELNGLAANLEAIDSSLQRLDRRMHDFRTNFPAYLSAEETEKELADLSALLALVPDQASLARRVAGLAKALGRWGKVEAVLEPFAETGPPDLIRDLGTALCQLHSHEKAGLAFERGRAMLRRATEADPTDADAWATLAGTYKGENEQLSAELYERAFLVAPDNSYPLGNVLESYLLIGGGDLHGLRLMQPVLRTALRRCQHRAAVGVDLPWSYLDQGRLHLLLAESDAALDAYCAGAVVAAAAFPLQTSRRSLDILQSHLPDESGASRARDLLTLALFARFGIEPDRVSTLDSPVRQGALTIVAIGPSTAVGEPAVRESVSALVAALQGVTSQVVCITDNGGVAPAPAELEHFPPNVSVLGTTELLQLFGDTLRLGSAEEVAVVAVGPEVINVSVRLAIALGVRVGVITRRSDEAAAAWPGADQVLPLPLDIDAIRAFLPRKRSHLPWETREQMARSVHEGYRRRRVQDTPSDPTQVGWNELDEEYRNANRAQADAIDEMVASVGRRVVPAPSPGAGVVTGSALTEIELEQLARMEHGRWCVDRLTAGWRWGKQRNGAACTTPDLVPWAELPEDVRQYDREAVRAIPTLLADVGLAIEPATVPRQPGEDRRQPADHPIERPKH